MQKKKTGVQNTHPNTKLSDAKLMLLKTIKHLQKHFQLLFINNKVILLQSFNTNGQRVIE